MKSPPPSPSPASLGVPLNPLRATASPPGDVVFVRAFLRAAGVDRQHLFAPLRREAAIPELARLYKSCTNQNLAQVETIENIDPEFGGASRDRTDDLIVANDALSQLSYSPTLSGLCNFISDAGFGKTAWGGMAKAYH